MLELLEKLRDKYAEQDLFFDLPRFEAFFSSFSIDDVHYIGTREVNQRTVFFSLNQQFFQFTQPSDDPKKWHNVTTNETHTTLGMFDFLFLQFNFSQKISLLDCYARISSKPEIFLSYVTSALNRCEISTLREIINQIVVFKNAKMTTDGSFECLLTVKRPDGKLNYRLFLPHDSFLVELYTLPGHQKTSFFHSILSDIEAILQPTRFVFPSFCYESEAEVLIKSHFRHLLSETYKQSKEYKVRNLFAKKIG